MSLTGYMSVSDSLVSETNGLYNKANAKIQEGKSLL
jgi:hypothetical protein